MNQKPEDINSNKKRKNLDNEDGAEDDIKPAAEEKIQDRDDDQDDDDASDCEEVPSMKKRRKESYSLGRQVL